MLFLLEFNQCKQLLRDKHSDFITDDIVSKEFLSKIKVSLGGPKMDYQINPDIIKVEYSEDFDVADCKKCFRYFYDNYIYEDGVNTINISGYVKRKLVKTLIRHHLVKANGDNINKAKTLKHELPLVVIHSFNIHKQKKQEKETPDDVNTIKNPRGIKGSKANNRHSVTNSNLDKKLDHQISDMILEIIDVFEKAGEEVFLMLYKDTWPRFKRTKQFKEYQQEIHTLKL